MDTDAVQVQKAGFPSGQGTSLRSLVFLWLLSLSLSSIRHSFCSPDQQRRAIWGPERPCSEVKLTWDAPDMLSHTCQCRPMCFRPSLISPGAERTGETVIVNFTLILLYNHLRVLHISDVLLGVTQHMRSSKHTWNPKMMEHHLVWDTLTRNDDKW